MTKEQHAQAVAGTIDLDSLNDEDKAIAIRIMAKNAKIREHDRQRKAHYEEQMSITDPNNGLVN